MKIGVLSDTHGNVVISEKIINNMGPVDLVLHAGDFYRDAEKLAKKVSVKIIGVVGNCDSPVTSPEEELIDAAGLKIYLIHGHQFEGVNLYNSLYYKAKEVKADIVVYGHTHIASKFEQEGILFFNPGSISNPRFQGPTYGILSIDGGEIEAEIIPYEP